MSFNFDYYLDGENEVDIFIESRESYTFEGVSTENPVDLNNIANISFAVMNGSNNSIIGVNVEVTYTTTTGNSKQTAEISLYAENDTENAIQTQSVTFKGKQNNAIETISFTNLDIPTGTKLTIKFEKGNVANGAVDVSHATIKPIY